MSNRRIERVSKLVKEQIGEILLKLNLQHCGFVTVTAADVSPDLHEGRIYISVIGTPAQEKLALAELERQHGVIQNELASRVVLKYTPRLHFQLDDTESHARHIESLLEEIVPETESEEPPAE